MYEIFAYLRDDWGKSTYYKVKGNTKKLQTAIKKAKKYGHGAYVKRYGDRNPVFMFLNDKEIFL